MALFGNNFLKFNTVKIILITVSCLSEYTQHVTISNQCICLFSVVVKGQVLSPSIRLLNKHGGYVWVQICATSLYNSKSNDDQTILAIFHVLR